MRNRVGRSFLFAIPELWRVLAVLEDAAKPGGDYSPPRSRPDPLRNFIDAMVGMLEAPWTDPAAPKRGRR
jgi:hypothetical protein